MARPRLAIDPTTEELSHQVMFNPAESARVFILNIIVHHNEYINEPLRVAFWGQYYVALAAYVENCLWRIIAARLEVMHLSLIKAKTTKTDIKVGGDTYENVDITPLIHIGSRQAKTIADKLSSSALNDLFETYNSIHTTKLNSLLGKELSKEWDIIRDLRNCIAHGSYISYDTHPEKATEDYSSSKLNLAVSYFKEINMIPKIGAKQFMNLFDFQIAYHLYESVRQICDVLDQSVGNAAEHALLDSQKINPLPDIASLVTSIMTKPEEST